mmetsp:Transcript_8116/g.27020  ORF Transcript_8116/g.27020 Transcript_8116/m.27020 type:complete len:206 (-) Transcript_8116:440-1057(-)
MLEPTLLCGRRSARHQSLHPRVGGGAEHSLRAGAAVLAGRTARDLLHLLGAPRHGGRQDGALCVPDSHLGRAVGRAVGQRALKVRLPDHAQPHHARARRRLPRDEHPRLRQPQVHRRGDLRHPRADEGLHHGNLLRRAAAEEAPPAKVARAAHADARRGAHLARGDAKVGRHRRQPRQARLRRVPPWHRRVGGRRGALGLRLNLF